MSEEPRRSWGRGLVDRRLVEDPSYFIAGRPKAALLFWFFGGFRCDVPLFIVFASYILVQRWVGMDVECWTSRWPPVWETAVHLAVAGGVFDGVFCAVLFPTRCLG